MKEGTASVFVGLSGGVDSAVSAALLKEAGYKVTGVFIKITLPGYPCTAGFDRIEAMRVAAHLDIPFIEIDLSQEYKRQVFDSSVTEFERGRTPNPDTLCNREIKFGAFYRFAMEHGADFVATGHYARLEKGNLLMSRDAEKDQTYFLWAVPKEHLARTLFPVGGYEKSHVRELARKFNLPNAARRDSQGLCFLGDISIEDMLEREIAPVPGNILNEDGEVLGTHRGAALYTLGQRHGFILKNTGAENVPHFVIGKDAEKNTITVSTERFPRNASSTRITLAEENWIADLPSGEYEARFRYRQKLIRARVTREGNKARVLLLEPHYVPLGQSLVLYREETCMGGGIIDSATLIG